MKKIVVRKLRFSFWISLGFVVVLSLSFLLNNPPRSLASMFRVNNNLNRIKIASLVEGQTTAMGTSCSDVNYGKLELQKRKALSELPLNQLLITLDQPASILPPNPNGATLVSLGLLVDEITDIKADSNTFKMEGLFDIQWCDPREKFTPVEKKIPGKIFLEKDAEKEIEKIWWPDVTFVNKVGPLQKENEELIIQPDGTIHYREHFQAELATNLDLKKFPFDQQILLAEIESFAWSSNNLLFFINDKMIGFSEEFSVPEWKVIKVTEHTEIKQEKRDRKAFSQVITEIKVQRDPGYYITKIMIPLGTIVIISWAVFWMIGDGLADRMSVSFTGVLTVVAYQFIVSDNLPRHIYNNFLDGMVLLSFVMMALTVLENIIVNQLYIQNSQAIANRIDFNCRWLFPLIYFSSIAILGIFYLL